MAIKKPVAKNNKPNIVGKMIGNVNVGEASEDKTSPKPSTIVSGQRRVGMSKGVTLNLGNYQSARIDAWMEKVVVDDEHSINEAIISISEEIDAVLEMEQNKLEEE